MNVKWEAFVRAFRTFVQGAVAAGVIAAWEAGYTAVQGGTYNPRLVIMAAVTAASGALVTYGFNFLAPKVGIVGAGSVEALVRALRTVVQTVVAVGLVALWDSVYATVTGGNYSPRDVVAAAVAAVATAVMSYLHNLVQPVQTVKVKGNSALDLG